MLVSEEGQRLLVFGSFKSLVGVFHGLCAPIASGPFSIAPKATQNQLILSITYAQTGSFDPTSRTLTLTGIPLSDKADYFLLTASLEGLSFQVDAVANQLPDTTCNLRALSQCAEFILRTVMLVAYHGLVLTKFEPLSRATTSQQNRLAICFSSVTASSTAGALPLEDTSGAAASLPRTHHKSYFLIHTTSRATREKSQSRQAVGETWVGHLLPGCHSNMWFRVNRLSRSENAPTLTQMFGTLATPEAFVEIYIASVLTFLMKSGEHDQEPGVPEDGASE